MKNLSATLALAAALLGGCATAPEDIKSAAELYADATGHANAARYEQADDAYAQLKSTYPTSPYARQAVLDQLYGYLQRREHLLAVAAADEFLNLYPGSPHVPYALYMKGVVYFREDRGLMDRIGQQDPSSRSPDLMQHSYESFAALLANFPDSPYAEDAALRMRYLINALAKSELHIARYYHRRAAYPAAIGRLRDLLATYPDAAALPQALALLADSYSKIGAADAAADTQRLLEANFPDGAADAAGQGDEEQGSAWDFIPDLPDLPDFPDITLPKLF